MKKFIENLIILVTKVNLFDHLISIGRLNSVHLIIIIYGIIKELEKCNTFNNFSKYFFLNNINLS